MITDRITEFFIILRCTIVKFLIFFFFYFYDFMVYFLLFFFSCTNWIEKVFYPFGIRLLRAINFFIFYCLRFLGIYFLKWWKVYTLVVFNNKLVKGIGPSSICVRVRRSKIITPVAKKRVLLEATRTTRKIFWAPTSDPALCSGWDFWALWK